MMQGPRIKGAAAALIALSLNTAFAQEATTNGSEDASPLFVRTMIVGEPTKTQERKFFGRIAALETADLSFEVPGLLSALNAPRGSFVRQGDAIAALDIGPFQRAVERAELTLSQAERDRDRARALNARNVSSEVQMQDAETARDLAEVALRDARAALEDAEMTAPFNGIVADRLVATFTNISPGQPVVRLHNMSEMRVEFDLPERILATVTDPSRVDFTTVLPGQTDPVPLEFREIQAETGAVGQSYTISLAVTGEAPDALLPGKTVTVTARLVQQGNAIPVPATAVVTRPDGATTVIGVSERDGALRPQFLPVEVLSVTGTSLAIVGIEPGTEIVELGGHLVSSDTTLARYSGLILEGN